MFVKVLKHGTGSGRAAVAYLQSKLDHKKERRACVKVLRGDPFLVGQLIDSLKFKHRYTSVVIAWQPKDKQNRQQIEQVLDMFEITARSGLAPDRLGLCAILHVDQKGGQHVHILVARVDLLTGKSFNLAPPGWQPTFDHFCDYFNNLYGWANPGIPSTSSIEGLDPDAPEPSTLAIDIERRVLRRIRSGFIKSRPNLLLALSRYGEIVWDGHRVIKLRPWDCEKPITLKGAIFSKNCDFERAARTLQSDQSMTARIDVAHEDRAGVALTELSKRIRKRAEFNLRRYGNAIGDRNLAGFDDSELLICARKLPRQPLPDKPPVDGYSTVTSEDSVSHPQGVRFTANGHTASTVVEQAQEVRPDIAQDPYFG